MLLLVHCLCQVNIVYPWFLLSWHLHLPPPDVGAIQSGNIFDWENSFWPLQYHVWVLRFLAERCSQHQDPCFWWGVHHTLHSCSRKNSDGTVWSCKECSSVIMGPCCISKVKFEVFMNILFSVICLKLSVSIYFTKSSLLPWLPWDKFLILIFLCVISYSTRLHTLHVLYIRFWQFKSLIV